MLANTVIYLTELWCVLLNCPDTFEIIIFGGFFFFFKLTIWVNIWDIKMFYLLSTNSQVWIFVWIVYALKTVSVWPARSQSKNENFMICILPNGHTFIHKLARLNVWIENYSLNTNIQVRNGRENDFQHFCLLSFLKESMFWMFEISFSRRDLGDFLNTTFWESVITTRKYVKAILLFLPLSKS